MLCILYIEPLQAPPHQSNLTVILYSIKSIAI